MKLVIDVGDDNIVHSEISCGKNETFEQTRARLILAVKELTEQLKNQTKCPMHPSKKKGWVKAEVKAKAQWEEDRKEILARQAKCKHPKWVEIADYGDTARYQCTECGKSELSELPQ